MKKNILAFVFLLCAYHIAKAQDLKLWYNQPAQNWMNEALPIGNGYMGAMFYGGTTTDEVQLSEESLWAGGPGSSKNYNGGNKKGSWKKLAEVQALLQAGKIKEAGELANTYFTGDIHSAPSEAEFGDYGALQPFGSLWVTVEKADTLYSGYSRNLNISKSIGEVSYEMGGTKFKNSYFASYPARLIILKYTNDAPDGENYTLALSSPHPLEGLRKSNKNTLTIKGKLLSNGLPFEACLLVKTDGKNSLKNGKYRIENARNIEIHITVASAYKNEYPLYRGTDYHAINQQAINHAQVNSYEKLKQEHISDFENLFNRVTLDLGKNKQENLPTNERQLQYSRGAYDPGLEELYFQYGRYLLISSSRPGTLPAHLQGKWNNKMNPAWACDYHMNINLQMIYWPAEVTNLSECHQPLIEYIDKLREPGRVTAREYFNARGWSVHTMNNAYGYTAPGWDFYWGYAPNSAAWLCNHVWEHFNFTKDENYLREKAYPIMKEVGEFWLDYLTEDKDGTLVSSPSYSPEHGNIAIGATIDQEIAWDLFSNLLLASQHIPGDSVFMDSVRMAREKLSPLKIGRYGQLQEWKEDLDDPASEHRHVSHLYALYPGNQISLQTTPKLANAAKKTLIYRGEEGTGWSLGWKINFWARLVDGNQSYKMIRNLLRPSLSQDGYYNRSGSGSYNNLLCAHPPFQIDGNMGAVSGISEMLLQSHTECIDLLPALPTAWPQGKVSGLKARGGYTIDMEWQDGLLCRAIVKATKPGKCLIRYKGKVEELEMKRGETREINW